MSTTAEVKQVTTLFKYSIKLDQVQVGTRFRCEIQDENNLDVFYVRSNVEVTWVGEGRIRCTVETPVNTRKLEGGATKLASVAHKQTVEINFCGTNKTMLGFNVITVYHEFVGHVFIEATTEKYSFIYDAGNKCGSPRVAKLKDFGFLTTVN